MTTRTPMTVSRQRTTIWIFVAAGITLLVAANAHLVYVAATSQPECVEHLRIGEGSAQQFSAAKSSCSSR
ncbi:MAG: hypothetical protein KF742_07550 [Cryobacterium sp.]|nr:hypothetical protein [Cryobacterium sp.]